MRPVLFSLLFLVPILGTSSVRGEILEREWSGLKSLNVRAVSADGRFAAVTTTAQGLCVKVLDVSQGSFVWGLWFDDIDVAVAFTPDSNQLLVGRTNGYLEAYDLTTGQKLLERELVFNAPISAISIAKESSEIFISSPRGPSHWSYPGLFRMHSFGGSLQANAVPPNEEPYSYLRFTSAVMPDASYAVEGDATLGEVRLFNLKSGAEIIRGGPFCSYSGQTAHTDGFTSFREPTTVARVGFSSPSTVITLKRSRTPGTYPIATLVESDFLSGASSTEKLLAKMDSLHVNSIALSDLGTRILLKFDQIVMGNQPRTRHDCSAWISDFRNNHQPLVLKSSNVVPSGGTVVLTADGKTALTCGDDEIIRVWRLP